MRIDRWRLSVAVVGWLAGLWVAGGLSDARAGEPTPADGDGPLASAIEAEIAERRTELAALEALEEQWLRQDAAQEADLQRQLEAVILLGAQLDDAGRGSSEAGELFDRIREMAVEAIEDLSRTIDAAKQPLRFGPLASGGMPSRPSGRFGTAGADGAAVIERTRAAATLEDLERREERQIAALRKLEIDLRLASLNRHVSLAGRIWNLRVQALHSLPPLRRAAAFSLDRPGRAEIELEVAALQAVLRLQMFRAAALLRVVPQKIRSFLAALKLGAGTVKLLLLVLLWRWLRRNGSRYVQKLHARALSLEDPRQRRLAGSGVQFLAAVLPWGRYLLMLGLLSWVFSHQVRTFPGAAVVLILAVAYGVYRLVADVAVGVLTDAMSRAGMDLSEELQMRLTSRVRWVLRLATVFAILLATLSYRLGHGVTYAHLRVTAWVTVLVVLVAALGGLRDEIAGLFLATRAHGRFARLVRRTRERPVGRLVAPVAFLYLVALLVGGVARNILYNFERTRSAGTYLSRRRLEKSAERDGYAEGDLERLPPRLVEALDPNLQIDDLEALEKLTDLEPVQESIAAWRRGESGGSMLLAGDEGLGKTAWLNRLGELETIDVRVEPERRLMNSGALLRWLAREVLGEEESSDRAELVKRLTDGPQRIVVIERAERLFLTTVNGYHALRELGPVIDGTRLSVFWVLSMGELGWNHLRAAGKDLAFLRHKVLLKAWEEHEIGALVRRRVERSGVTVSFADLMTHESRGEDRDVRDRQGEEAFLNLLWGYTGGNPHEALYYFARSLEPRRDEGVRVRPFRRPSLEELEALDDAAHFVIASIARHGSLTAAEAALATAFPLDRVQARVIRLLDMGVLLSESGSYRLATAWRSRVLQALRRHNILVS